jgi:hypothetical protein
MTLLAYLGSQRFTQRLDELTLHTLSFGDVDLAGREFVKVRQTYNEHLKNDVFWDVTPCDSCKNRRFGGT